MRKSCCLNPMAYMWNQLTTCMEAEVRARAKAGISDKDIVETASAASGFRTLVKAIDAAGLVALLEEEGPFTVFAPTDSAFARLPNAVLDDLLKADNREKLVAVLKDHVCPGRILASEVVDRDTVRTLSGRYPAITAQGGVVMIEDARVVQTDIDCTNGVIHAIDSVLMLQQ